MRNVSKKISWKTILIFEGLLLLLVIGMAIIGGKNLKEISYEGAQIPFGTDEEQVPESAVSLKRGSYEVTISYSADREVVCQTWMQTAYGKDYADEIILPKETTEKNYELMLYHNVSNLYVCAIGSKNALDIQKITIRKTNQWNRMVCALLVVAFLILDICIWQKKSGKWEAITPEKKMSALR